MSLVKMYYITNVVYMVVLLFYSIPVPNTDSTYICFVSWLELIHVHQDSIVNFQRWIMMDSFYLLITSLPVVPLCKIVGSLHGALS